ncbi:uracil-DNA glycosylase [Bordetella sp. 2513F-2]
MNAVRHGVPQAPRPNPLQRLWLREIGIEKTWLQGAETAPMPVAAPPASVGASGPGPGPATVRPEVDVSTRGAPPAAPVAPPPGPAAAPRDRGPARTPAPASVSDDAGPDAAERLAAIGRADLPELRAMVETCTACGLCKGRRNAVFGMGAEPSAVRWMVVGEAPGAEEDRQGLPFVGRSGQLLDAMLASVGMSRERDVYIANVIKCRPPGNRNPTPEEIAACGPYLMRQISLLQPERILVLGRFAAQTLLGTDATIGSLRGRAHAVEIDGRRIPIVVSYHPAYLLRSPFEKARSWQDLRLAASL